MYTCSPLFPRFFYTRSGKDLLLELAIAFAEEFNTKAETYLSTTHGRSSYSRLTVTGAYPTSRQHLPTIAIVRQNLSPQPSGIGLEIDTYNTSAGKVRHIVGEVVTDTVEVSICTLNPLLRDDLFAWFQQWMLDAILHLLPQVTPLGIQSIRNLGGTDDTVVYEGLASQPGFEFYVGRLLYAVQYDQMILENLDAVATIFNWQSLLPTGEWLYRGTAGIPQPEPLRPTQTFQAPPSGSG